MLVALVLVVSPYRRECATLPWRFIRRAPRLVNDLRPDRDSNAGPTAEEVVSRARAGRPSCARCAGRQAKVAGAAKVVKRTVEATTDEITSELQEALKS